MHEAVDLLEAARDAPPAERLAVCQKAIVGAVAVILKADDSSGIIGDAVRRLLNLHPQLTAQTQPPVARLVDWLIAFQFNGRQDFFEIDPVAYTRALGDLGLKRYRDQLQRLRNELGPGPVPRDLLTLLGRPHWSLEQERSLLAAHRIGVLVTKDSGGPTAAKLVAAGGAGPGGAGRPPPRAGAAPGAVGPGRIGMVESNPPAFN